MALRVKKSSLKDEGCALRCESQPNNGMHPTRDTKLSSNFKGLGGRVMPGVRLLPSTER
jgi:hypothetical protein